jgi:hypothetical protein
MNLKSHPLKPVFLTLCAGLFAVTLGLNLVIAASTEFLQAKCLTWNSCAQCVEGFGSTIGQSSSTCFAAVGGFGNGTALHCVTDSTFGSKMCRYRVPDADPGTQQCAGAAVYLCDIIDDECDCECSGSADLSGVILTDTTICETI